MVAEKRSSARAAVYLEAILMADDDGYVRHGVVIDASASGACLETREPLAEGMVLVVKLRREPELPAVVARVVWAADERAGVLVLENRAQAREAWGRAFTRSILPSAPPNLEAHTGIAANARELA